MNNDPRRENGGTGQFRLQIDERDLATGTFDPLQPDPGRRSSGNSYNYNQEYATEAERKAEQKAHKKRNRVKARKNKRVFFVVWLCMVLLLSFTAASYLISGSNDFFAVGRPANTVEIEIPREFTADELADILYGKGAINKKEFFKLYVSLTVDEDEWEYFEPGVYELGTNMDYQDIISTLQGGNESREVVTVTFPEGITALEAAQLLEDNQVCTKEDFLTALNGDYSNYEYIAALGGGDGRYYKLEGYLFPDTYDFWKGEDIDSVVGKMVNNFHTKMGETTLNAIYASGYTLDQIITIASIVQNEAANVEDMYKVSAVINNRLSYGGDYGIYYLQCDSTCFYPYKNKKQVPEDGAIPYGNYDTYQVTGLPAGPICNPGMDAINAALNPSTEGDAPYYLYFCHADDGTAYYATNEGDHLYNRQLAGLD